MNKQDAIWAIIAAVILVAGFLWHNAQVNEANESVCIGRDEYNFLRYRTDPIEVPRGELDAQDSLGN